MKLMSGATPPLLRTRSCRVAGQHYPYFS